MHPILQSRETTSDTTSKLLLQEVRLSFRGKKERKGPILDFTGRRPDGVDIPRTLSGPSRKARTRRGVHWNPSVCKDIDGAKGVRLRLESGVGADFVSASIVYRCVRSGTNTYHNI